MATRFYFTTGTTGFYPAVAQGTWNDLTLMATSTYALSKTKAGASVASSRAETSATNNWKVLLHRHVSGPLVGGTMPAFTSATSPFQHVQARQQSAAGMTATVQMHIYFTVGDSDTVRGTWFANFTGGTAFATTLTAFSYTTPGQATTAVSVQPGDRMVIEVGYNAANVVTTSFTGTLQIGGTAGDLATTGTTGVTTDSPWIEFPASCDAILVDYVPQNYTPSVADTAAAADAVTASVGFPRSASDTAAATDSATALLSKNVADVAAATDTMTRVLQMARNPADVAGVTDEVFLSTDRADIEDYQFVMSEGPQTAGGWVPFGLGQTVVVEKFDPGSAETRNQDILSPVADVRYFGTDRKTPPTWSFTLYTDVEDAGQALGWSENFEAVWDREDLRTTSNGVTPLRYKIAGRVRRVYGRPSNFAMVPEFVRTGRVTMLADFRLAENTFYDDDQLSVTTRIRSSTPVGFTFPLSFPAGGVSAPEPRVEQALVGGTRPTWLDVVFTGGGGVNDPWVQIGNYRFGLNGTIGVGQSVRLSGKPWQQGVLRSDGAWDPGMLDPRARLSQLRLPPGNYPVSMGGYDLTEGATATVTWRNAYGTM